MTYLPWFLALALLFLVLERLFPWRAGQALLRPGWRRDLGFLALNGHLFAVATAGANAWLALEATRLLRGVGLSLPGSPVGSWPFPAQFAALLVLSDFLQWGVHNLLHRVPLLWQFHKVHHSVTIMDWAGNFRFHWMEIIVYKSLQWLPLAWLGASAATTLAVAVVSTFWGDFNHSNLNVGLGAGGYVFNNPRMHLWHHDASTEGGVAKNFGVVLSLWDFLFGTAYWPRERSPQRLGYPGMEEMPESFTGEVLFPLTRRKVSPAEPPPAAPTSP